jgi:streptogramin lyase
MYLWDGAKWRNPAPDWTPFVHSIYLAPDDSLWLCLYGEGVTRIDNEGWIGITSADGLIDDNVRQVYVQDDGTVWFATEGGAARYSP